MQGFQTWKISEFNIEKKSNYKRKAAEIARLDGFALWGKPKTELEAIKATHLTPKLVLTKLAIFEGTLLVVKWSRKLVNPVKDKVNSEKKSKCWILQMDEVAHFISCFEKTG